MVAAAVGLVLLIAGFVLSILSLLRNSNATALALQMAGADEHVSQAIGAPWQPGRFVQGNIVNTNDTGTASLRIPLHGPAGTGTLYADEFRVAGTWRMKKLTFAQEGKTTEVIVYPERDALVNDSPQQPARISRRQAAQLEPRPGPCSNGHCRDTRQ